MPSSVQSCILNRVILTKDGKIVLPSSKGLTYIRRIYIDYEKKVDEVEAEDEEATFDEKNYFEVFTDATLTFGYEKDCSRYYIDKKLYPQGITLKDILKIKEFRDMLQKRPICLDKIIGFKMN